MSDFMPDQIFITVDEAGWVTEEHRQTNAIKYLLATPEREAAPELYAALKEITQKLEMLEVVDNFPEWHGKAVAALALVDKETT